MSQVAPADHPRLESQLALLRAVRALAPGGRTPEYFAHMRLAHREPRSGRERTSDVLLGSARRLGPGVSIVEWRTAPLAQVFFSCEEGEPYEVELEGRTLEGTLVEKNLLGFEGGDLAWIEWAGGRLRREGAHWRLEPSSRSAVRVEARPEPERRPFRSPLEVTLDAAQRRVVDLPSGRHVLLLGEAGFGKTTVALHRLAALRQQAGEAFRGLVLVPTAGLRKLTSLMLERRGVQGVEVWTWDAWAAKVARHAFPDLPERASTCIYGGVVRAKRHRALGPILEEYVRERPAPPEAERGAHASRYDLERIFGDRERMARLVDAAGGAIRRTAVEELAEHTRVQFSDPTERAYRHADAGSLVTSDGRAIDEGTPMENAGSADVEDYPVLFEIDRLRAAARGEPPASVPRYDCVVIDEAQELAPLELSLAGRALRRGGTLIIAGDAAQQVDPDTDFPGWDGVMNLLAAPEHERAVLEVNYRCPPAVTDLARGVLDPSVARPADPSIARVLRSAPAHLAMWLIEELARLSFEDRTASIAVICRSSGRARSLSRTLKHGVEHQLSLGGDFDLAPGVLVTAVPEVKGLEFDYVFVPDADATDYPDTPESRRTLYVALTRATHRLVLTGCGRWSPLLPD